MIAKSIKTELDLELANHMKKSLLGTLETDEIMFQEDP